MAAILWNIYTYYNKDKKKMMELISIKGLPVDNIYREPSIFDLFNNVSDDKKLNVWRIFESHGFPFIDLLQPTDVEIQQKTVNTYTVTAKDNVGIGRVDFFINDKYICSDRSAPFTVELTEEHLNSLKQQKKKNLH